MATSNAIPIIFENKTTFSDDQVFVHFLNGAFGPGQTGAEGTVPLSGDTAFSFAQLKSAMSQFPGLGIIPNVTLNDFTNGRIYFSLGNSLTDLGNGYQPSSNNTHDLNYNTIYAYIEPNVFGNVNNNMDLSAIDFFSFPISAATYKNNTIVNQLKCDNPAEMGSAVEKLMTLSNNQAVVNTGQQFTRVNGPGLAPGYHDWSSYLAYLATLSYPTQIAGLYVGQKNGTGTTAQQKYQLSAVFDASKQEVTLSGSCAVVGETTITISYQSLNAQTGIYGANPSYSYTNGGKTVTTNGIVNDVFGRIVGDLLSGINMGYVGSSAPDPTESSKTIGELSSEQWFQLAGSNPETLFGGAQSDANYYNGWAATLSPVIDAYNFPFNDRYETMLLYFPPSGDTNGVDYLKITLHKLEFPA